ncbi:MAG: hypothetical protein JKY41_14305 [Rhodobacteraceae bacterium]|nr:hypothetical protein [Paracoccaceae bacterium]
MEDKLEYWIVDMLENLGAAMYEKQMYRSAEAMVEMQLLAINEIRTSENKNIVNKEEKDKKESYRFPRIVP